MQPARRSRANGTDFLSGRNQMANKVRGPNGGPRSGAGRPVGARSKTTLERELRAIAGVEAARNGVLPLDVLLAAMRAEPLPNGRHPTDQQIQCAIAAAPYLHARLASATVTVSGDNVHRLISERPITLEEWCREHSVTVAEPP
jgi:hypothetical protein